MKLFKASPADIESALAKVEAALAANREAIAALKPDDTNYQTALEAHQDALADAYLNPDVDSAARLKTAEALSLEAETLSARHTEASLAALAAANVIMGLDRRRLALLKALEEFTTHA